MPVLLPLPGHLQTAFGGLGFQSGRRLVLAKITTRSLALGRAPAQHGKQEVSMKSHNGSFFLSGMTIFLSGMTITTKASGRTESAGPRFVNRSACRKPRCRPSARAKPRWLVERVG